MKTDKHGGWTAPQAVEVLANAGAFGSGERLAVAARRVIARHTQKLYDHLPGALSGEDDHDVHQMRVATRRLRATLQATRLAYGSKGVDGLRKRLRKLARALGEVRDRDVLLRRLREDIEAATETSEGVNGDAPTQAGHNELVMVGEQLQAERDAAHKELVAELKRKRTKRLLADLATFLTCPIEDVAADDDGRALLVRHHAGSAIWRQYEDVLRFETLMPHASMERLHELRLACKHLRYTLELFQPALGIDAAPLIKQVTAMQELLGKVNDADVAIVYLGKHRGPAATTNAPTATTMEAEPSEAQPQGGGVSGIDSYIATLEHERSSLRAGVDPLWKQLTGEKTRRKMARLLAAL